MRLRKILPLVALAFTLSACEEPIAVEEVDVQPAFAAAPAACQGQITSIIASTWPWAHNDKVAFPPPPGSIALWLQVIGEPFFGVSTVRELQALFCGASHMATGSGHRVDTRGDDPELFRNFSFAAHSDGGQFQIVNRTFDVRIHGAIDCLTVVGNQAWFAGPTTLSTRPGLIGLARGFRVVDNGQGNGVQDEITLAPLLGGCPLCIKISAQEWCDFQLTPDNVVDIGDKFPFGETTVLELNPVENGNIQVR